MTDAQKEDLKKIVKNPSKIYWDEPMKKHTSFKIGGPAECLIKVCEAEVLENILQYAKTNQIQITLLGNGSNILVLDNGIKGITLKIDIQKMEVNQTRNSENIETITVGAGNRVISLAYELLEKGLSGMEELSGIPGTIGGAVYMNAGANGREMKDVVTKITYLDENGIKKQMDGSDAEFSYRHSIFAEKEYVILEVTMAFQKGSKEHIKEKMEQYAKSRKQSQPLEYPNSGSTFKRGNDFITAKLIDECGLKGYEIGGAEVSTKHAGFVINKGNATAQDVLSLIKYIQDKVYEKFGKKIELEMKIIGSGKE